MRTGTAPGLGGTEVTSAERYLLISVVDFIQANFDVEELSDSSPLASLALEDVTQAMKNLLIEDKSNK